jgi:transcriptional regulator with XRE-family HTH domain
VSAHGGVPKISEETFGQRVKALREEMGLDQPGLAALFPPTSRGPRSANWISLIEKDKQKVRLPEIPMFAQVLGVDLRWLLTGEASGMTEFAARMSQLETRLDGTRRGSVSRPRGA